LYPNNANGEIDFAQLPIVQEKDNPEEDRPLEYSKNKIKALWKEIP
jgi:hypothetical protein